MEYSREDAGKTPLDDYVRVVASIYGTHDGHRSIWDVWCHTLHHAAGVAEQIRKGVHDDCLQREIADFSLWLFTMVLKLRGEFGRSEGSFEAPADKFIRIRSNCSDMLWQRYPRLCPSCHGTTISQGSVIEIAVDACDCRAHPRALEDEDAWRRRIAAVREYSGRIRSGKPSAIDEWQEMFGAVFSGDLSLFSLSDIALHLMEELGEVSDAMIRMYSYSPRSFVDGEPNWRQVRLEAQLADVFSWLFALVEKLNSLKLLARGSETQGRKMISTPVKAVSLSGIIWQRYGSDSLRSFCCWKCKLPACGCQIILVPATQPNAELLQKYRQIEP